MEDKRIELSDEQMKWAENTLDEWYEEYFHGEDSLTRKVKQIKNKLFRPAKTELEKEIDEKLEKISKLRVTLESYEPESGINSAYEIFIEYSGIILLQQEYIRKLKESQVTNK